MPIVAYVECNPCFGSNPINNHPYFRAREDSDVNIENRVRVINVNEYERFRSGLSSILSVWQACIELFGCNIQDFEEIAHREKFRPHHGNSFQNRVVYMDQILLKIIK